MLPFVIEQDEVGRKLAVEVHSNTYPKGIRLSKADVRSGDGVLAAEVSSAVSFKAKGKVLQCGPEDLIIEAQLHMSAETDGAQKAKIAEVGCTFEAIYALKPGFEMTLAHAKAFAAANALFNVWPYFREFLQSTTVRMGLPPIVAPFLVIKANAKKKGRG